MIASGVLAAATLAAGAATLPDGLYAEIWTPRGTITCRLEYARTPLTVASFVGLAEGTLGPKPRKPFFDGLKFHRVVPGFVIQGGDPLGTGEGGPGYSFPDEFVPGLGHGSVGALSMANDGPDTNGSQFFLTLAPEPRLNYLYSVFGHTVSGSDVLAHVVQGDPMKVHILRIGTDARAFRADDAAFAALLKAAKRYSGEPLPGPKAHFDDPDRLFSKDSPRPTNYNYKLCNIQRFTGISVYVRLYAKLPSGFARANALAKSLGQSLGLGERGAVAVYTAATDSWAIWLGQGSVPAFLGVDHFDPEVLTNGTLMDTKTVFYKEVGARTAEYALADAPLAKTLQDPDRKLSESVNGLMAVLIEKLTAAK